MRPRWHKRAERVSYGGPGVVDLLQGNVVVSSDASLAETGLTADERRRIEAALRRLDETG